MSKTAVCLVVKNEASHLVEWVAHHLNLGFDTIFVYDNWSTDGTAEIVDRMTQHYDVRYKRWHDRDFFYQTNAYMDCIAGTRNAFRWVAFIDSDEFLVPHGHKKIGSFLASFGDAAAVVVNWAMFGSSGHVEPPPGLVSENFIWRSNSDFYNAKHVKSIVEPSKVIRCLNAHVFEVDGLTLNTIREEPKWESVGIIKGVPIYRGCQINHYYTRSQSEWFKKVRRGYPDIDTSGFDDNRILEGFNYANRNEVYDVNIFYYIEDLKKLAADIYASMPQLVPVVLQSAT